MITIWGRLNSHNVKKVVWAAVEAEVEWQRNDIGGPFGYTDDYLAMNPNRLVPAIEDSGVQGGFCLWESNAILRYIADAYAPQLWSGTPDQRADADRWMDWQFAFADAQRAVFLQMVRVPAEERDKAKVEAGIKATNAMMAILEDRLGKSEWLSGEQFGIADIPMGTYAHTWLALGLDRIAAPNIRAWYARLNERAGYQYVTIPLT
ncbi:MAG: glutathione S-transferase family protein [Sphingomonadales bacterium]|nr:glutathione S-transferase family protein [Sphingomonadales bacterium]MDE2167973.1 glutathione S-transferase family protein [Sphingomonadales bacterium]